MGAGADPAQLQAAILWPPHLPVKCLAVIPRPPGQDLRVVPAAHQSLQVDTADAQIYVLARRCGKARRCLATNPGSTSHAASCQRTASLLLTALFNAQAASRSGASWTSLRIEGAPDVSDRALLACGAKAPRLRQLALVGLSGVTVRGLTSFMTTTSLESLELADLQALDGGEVRIFVAEISRGVSGSTLACSQLALLDDLDALCAATCIELGLTRTSMISG